MSESNSSCAPVSTPRHSDAMERALHLLRVGALEIDDQGRIWRVGHLLRSGAIKPVSRVRAENKSQKGYLRLTLGIPGTRSTATVSAHRVVWVWLNGAIPDAIQVNHKNLKRDDNHPDNLELVDQSGNIQHSYDNGRRKPWSDSIEWRPGKPRLSDEQKADVIARRARGETYRQIKQETGISQAHIGRILKGGAQ